MKMKNKNGFTLIELLAVIVIIALISIIVAPNITKVIKGAKSDTQNIQYLNVEDTLKTYITEHALTLGDDAEVCISDLKDAGLLENKPIYNPDTKEEYTGCFSLTWNNTYNQYDYTYSADDVTVTFNPNGGTVATTSKTVYVGNKYGTLPTPTREGYTFKGWNGKNKLDISKSKLSSIRNGQPLRAWGYIAFDTNWIIDNIESNNIYTISFDAECISVGEYDHEYSNNLGFFLYSTVLRKGLGGLKRQKLEVGEKVHIENRMNFIDEVFDIDNGYNIILYTNRYLKNNSEVLGNIKFTNIQLEEGSTATPYEPYYVTKDTTVVQTGNHTLTAIWEANS